MNSENELRLTEKQKKEIILKASIELSPLYRYKIKNGGLGVTLLVDAGTKLKASIARKLIPHKYEGIRTIVIYSSHIEEKENSEN